MQSLRTCLGRSRFVSNALGNKSSRNTIVATSSATTTTTTVLRRCFGSRGARGHGWYIKYRDGRGGRHLQGEYHDRESLAECQAWNAAVLGLGQQRVYMDVAVEPKQGATVIESSTIHDDNYDVTTTTTAQPPHVAIVPPEDSLSTPLVRLEMDVATTVMPQTCHNFTTLIENKEYDMSLLYRFEKQVGLSGGDILTNTGKTGRSHLSDRLSVNVHQDPLVLWHVPGTVSMLVSSVQEVDSRFFFCTQLSPHLDGIHRAFGQLTPESLAKVQEWQSSVLTRGGGFPTTYNFIVVKAGIVESSTSSSGTSGTDPSGPPMSTEEASSSTQTVSASA